MDYGGVAEPFVKLVRGVGQLHNFRPQFPVASLSCLYFCHFPTSLFFSLKLVKHFQCYKSAVALFDLL